LFINKGVKKNKFNYSFTPFDCNSDSNFTFIKKRIILHAIHGAMNQKKKLI